MGMEGLDRPWRNPPRRTWQGRLLGTQNARLNFTPSTQPRFSVTRPPPAGRLRYANHRTRFDTAPAVGGAEACASLRRSDLGRAGSRPSASPADGHVHGLLGGQLRTRSDVTQEFQCQSVLPPCGASNNPAGGGSICPIALGGNRQSAAITSFRSFWAGSAPRPRTSSNRFLSSRSRWSNRPQACGRAKYPAPW